MVTQILTSCRLPLETILSFALHQLKALLPPPGSALPPSTDQWKQSRALTAQALVECADILENAGLSRDHGICKELSAEGVSMLSVQPKPCETLDLWIFIASLKNALTTIAPTNPNPIHTTLFERAKALKKAEFKLHKRDPTMAFQSASSTPSSLAQPGRSLHGMWTTASSADVSNASTYNPTRSPEPIPNSLQDNRGQRILPGGKLDSRDKGGIVVKAMLNEYSKQKGCVACLVLGRTDAHTHNWNACLHRNEAAQAYATKHPSYFDDHHRPNRGPKRQ